MEAATQDDGQSLRGSDHVCGMEETLEPLETSKLDHNWVPWYHMLCRVNGMSRFARSAWNCRDGKYKTRHSRFSGLAGGEINYKLIIIRARDLQWAPITQRSKKEMTNAAPSPSPSLS